MSAYLKAANAIEEAFGCLVIIVHHCGIDGKRPRGHTSQTGAADVQISVKKDDAGIITATVEFAKDMAEGSTFVSRLKVLKLRPDPDEPNGDWITSCIIEPVDAEAKQSTEKQAQPGTQTKKASKDKWRSSRLRKALLNALATNGTDINPFPDGTKVRGVLLQTVRDEFSRAYPADGETEKLRRKATGEAWRRELKEFSNPEHPCIGVWENREPRVGVAHHPGASIMSRQKSTIELAESGHTSHTTHIYGRLWLLWPATWATTATPPLKGVWLVACGVAAVPSAACMA